MIEGLTDNRNRTTAEVRNMLAKKNGSLAGAGSTAWMFTAKGVINIGKDKATEEQLMEIALEAGAEDIGQDGDFFEVTCEPSSFEGVKQALTEKGIPLSNAEVTKVPNSTVKVVGNDARQLLNLMESLEEHEDIQAVHANFDIPDEEMEQASE